MPSDDRLRELLREADARVQTDPRALASIYANVEVERRRRSRRPAWVTKLMRAAPALAGAAAALVVLIGALQLLPDEPAATPTTSPTGSPSTTGGPTIPVAESPLPPDNTIDNLGPHIGSGSTTECLPWPPPSGGQDVLSPGRYATAYAHGSCLGPADGSAAQYAAYASTEALDAEYDAIMASQDIAPGGACTAGAPASASWDLPGYPEAGFLGCFARAGGVQYVWTDRMRRILGQWLAPDNPQGLAFWQQWTTSTALNDGYLSGAISPVSGERCTSRVSGFEATGALAFLACPSANGENPVFSAQYWYEDPTWLWEPGLNDGFLDLLGSPFPDDPMTRVFFTLMEEGGLDVDTTQGCFERMSGRYTWGLLRPGFTRDTGRVSDGALVLGYVGCYVRTVDGNTTTRLVWTVNSVAIIGVWDAPDIDRAMEYLDAWFRERHLMLSGNPIR